MNGGFKTMQFNNHTSIESIIFIVIIVVLIWYIFRLYKDLSQCRKDYEDLKWIAITKNNFLNEKGLFDEYMTYLQSKVDEKDKSKMEKLNG